MIICYYTENGRITHFHGTDYSLSKTTELAKQYNKRDSKKVTVVEVADDSLTAHLYRCAIERKKYNKETIFEIRNALSVIDDMVAGLELLGEQE